MAKDKLSRSQKELVAKLKNTEVTRYVGGGIDNSYPMLGTRVIQQKTMEQLISLGYAEEIKRERQTGSVEKITYRITDIDMPFVPTLKKANAEGNLESIWEEPIKHSHLRKAEAMEILQGGGFYEEQVGSRYNFSYWMGQVRLNAAWHNDWREQGLVESYDREYVNGTFRGCKWRLIGFVTAKEL